MDAFTICMIIALVLTAGAWCLYREAYNIGYDDALMDVTEMILEEMDHDQTESKD